MGTIIFTYAIAIFGLTEMLVFFDGPFDIIAMFRDAMTELSEKLGELFNCIFCTSTWIGIIFSIVDLCVHKCEFTPFNLIIHNDNLWYIIVPLDMMFACGSVYFLHSLRELIGGDTTRAEEPTEE